MTLREIQNLLTNRFGEQAIVGIEENRLQPALVVHPDHIVEVCRELKDNPLTWFDFLASLTGVDHGAGENKFSIVYHLSSIPHKKQLTLKVIREFNRTTETMPVFKTVSHLWKTADWQERETYDLLGIWFEGHPDLRRILLPDDWEGYPLRKDYKTAEYYKGIKIDY